MSGIKKTCNSCYQKNGPSNGVILYVGNFELPDIGASANRVMNNRKLFLSLGYKVVMLGLSHDSFSGLREAAWNLDVFEESYPVSTVAWAKHMGSLKAISEVVSNYSNVKMILLYNLPFLLVCRCKHYFSKFGIKVCYDCTEWTHVTDGSLLKRFIKNIDGYFIQNHLPTVTDGLIVVSKRMEQGYKEKSKLLRLPPLVDINDSIWYTENSYRSKEFEFCFAGMLDGAKDSLDVIIECFLNIPNQNAVLRIIGVDREEFLRYYPNMRDNLKSSDDKIIFMGKRSHTETIHYILRCDCYVFARVQDLRNNAGFPTKFVEAFTSGNKILCTDVSNISDYIPKNSKRVILSNLDSVQLTKKIKQISKAKAPKNDGKLDETFHYANYRVITENWLKQVFAN